MSACERDDSAHLAVLNEGATVLRNVGKNPPTRRHIPEDLTLQQHRCENLKCRLTQKVFWISEFAVEAPLEA